MILHIDMDAFYASVEEREQPELRGKPLIVGGSPTGRGVVSAANYAVRKFGVHSAMPTARALRLCPEAVILRPRMDLYAGIAKQIRAIFHRYTPVVEPLSLDEAFLDVSGSRKLFGSAEAIGKRIKHEILEELQLVASVGVAPNKFLAKLASDLEKPDGFTVIPEDRVQEILDPLSISRIWGVGKVTQQKLERLGIHTFGHLRGLSEDDVTHLLGKSGEHFWRLAQGIDSRRVVSERGAKTISHESTFPVDIVDLDVLRARLLELTEQVGMRLRSHSYLGRTISIKVRYSDFHTITRSRSLEEASNTTSQIWEVVSELFSTELPKRKLEIRLLGVGVSNLEPHRPTQLSLFDDQGQPTTSDLDQTTDRLRNLFGRNAIRRGSTMQGKTSPPSAKREGQSEEPNSDRS